MAYNAPFYNSPYVSPYGQYQTPLPAYQPVYSTPPQGQAATVQPQTQFPQMQTAQNQQSAIVSGINWVTEEQAISFPPSTGTPVALWTRDTKRIYLKYLDNMGKPVTVVLEYRELDANATVSESTPQTGNDTAYALKSDLDALRAEIAPVLALVKQEQHPKRLKEEADGE